MKKINFKVAFTKMNPPIPWEALLEKVKMFIFICISRELIYNFCFPKQDTQRNARVPKAMVNSLKHNVGQII